MLSQPRQLAKAAEGSAHMLAWQYPVLHGLSSKGWKISFNDANFI